jgi:hypothetical protein
VSTDPLRWQQSSYCPEGNSCVNLAASPNGTLHLRESDDPDVVLHTTPTAIRLLLKGLQSADGHR